MKDRGFTLLELLVVVAVIAVLAGLAFPVFMSLKKSGHKTREIHAGRQLATAYASAAQDQDGTLLAGYASSAEALDDLGRPVASPISNRYPWRLAKYLNYQVVGTLIVNEQAKIADHRENQQIYNYLVSLAPTFGMNAILVGGDFKGALAPTPMTMKRLGKFCITRMSEAHTPGRMILFASAHYLTAEAKHYGYHTVEPPNLRGSNWAGKFDPEDARSLGYVDLRYDGQAVAVMLDGHVELLTEEQLRDMRRWSNQASEANDPQYVLGQG